MMKQCMQLHSSHSAYRAAGLHARQSKPSHDALSRRGVCTALRPGAEEAVNDAKHELLSRVAGTNRGSEASSWTRALVEEAQVELERHGGDVDYSLLSGRWRLIYTTAEDVRPLAGTARLPFFPLQVGDIYQQFSADPGSMAGGEVKNIIKFSIAGLLQPEEGAIFTVDARYDVRSGQRIGLIFEAANLGDVKISSSLETILAPALLPRSWINHQLLLALQQLHIRVPLPTTSRQHGSPVGEYVLTFLDEHMLIGRAQQGSFLFLKHYD